MTKVEKLRAVGEKIFKANNKLRTMYYYGDKCERENVELMDLYNPIFFKYHKDLMEKGALLSLNLYSTDDGELWTLGYVLERGNEKYEHQILHPDQISEEMLDEMLAVKDCGEVVQARMTKKSIEYTYNDYLAKKNEEVAKESERKAQAKKVKQDKWNDFNFVLSLIALGVSLIALIVKLC